MRLLPLLLLLACADDFGVTKNYTPPEITFVEPMDGASFLQGEAVTFRATVTDAQDDPTDLRVTWQSDLDGLLDEGAPDATGATIIADATLSTGIHAILLTALDTEAGESVESIAVEIVAVAEAPDIAFIRPLPGDLGHEGTSTDIEVQVSDVQDAGPEMAVAIESDVDGPLCTPAADSTGRATCEATLSPGDHVLSATVIDTSGYDAHAEAAYTVVAATAWDDDGDGWTEDQGDCNDADESVSPDATEVPDGNDDDCDGVADEGTDAFDDDLDGVSENDGDCDDAAASVFPGAPEVCDAVDQDCDGVMDDTTECADDDGDGYTELAGDCDDADDDVSPDASETEDGRDEDCDGDVDNGTPSFDDDADCACEAEVCTGSLNTGCGALTGGDCDDADPNRSPDAPEWCNGIDDDCDGSSDEDDAIDAGTWYADLDLDGYGDPANPVQACVADSTWRVVGDDCDDGDSDVKPGASESCDEQDNDCDGTIDEDEAVDASTWFLDADGDGHGDAAFSAVSCAAPAGYVAAGDDCDDSNPSRNCPDW